MQWRFDKVNMVSLICNKLTNKNKKLLVELRNQRIKSIRAKTIPSRIASSKIAMELYFLLKMLLSQLNAKSTGKSKGICNL